MRARRPILILVATVYCGALIGLSFVPGSTATRSFWLSPFLTFLPVGVLLMLLLGRRRWWLAIAFAGLGAAWVEAGQSVWMPEGYSDPMDLVWATTGAILGVGAVAVGSAARRDSMRAHDLHRMVAQSDGRESPQD